MSLYLHIPMAMGQIVQRLSNMYPARTDTGYPLTFLRCDIWLGHPSNETDCRAFLTSANDNDGKLTIANRYSINGWSHRHIEGALYTSKVGGRLVDILTIPV